MIRKFEYDRAVLLSDFLAKIKNVIEKNPQISDVHFIPEINGYKINFNNKSKAVEISLCFEKNFSDKVKIKVFEGEKLKGSYVSKSKENNTEILSDIF